MKTHKDILLMLGVRDSVTTWWVHVTLMLQAFLYYEIRSSDKRLVGSVDHGWRIETTRNRSGDLFIKGGQI